MKNDINRLFDGITPVRSDEEILAGVLRKAETMENTNKKRKLSFKKPIIAICAAAAAVSLGITGAAAAGIIEFDKLFGGYITAENEKLGEELISVNSDFRYTVSDDDYVIELEGVTGSSTEIIAKLELKRADGKPVIEDFINEYNPIDNISSADEVRCIEQFGFNKYTINESGNIAIDLNFCALTPLSGEILTAEGSGFYPTDVYFDFVSDNHIGSSDIAEADTSGFIYLPIDWSFSFEYMPSEKALVEIEADGFSEPVTLASTSYTTDSQENFTAEYMPAKARLTATRCYLNLTANASDYESYIIDEKENNVRLIKNDGTEVNAFISYSSTSLDGEVECGILYSKEPVTYDEKGAMQMEMIAIDVAEIEAMEINGTLIPLK